MRASVVLLVAVLLAATAGTVSQPARADERQIDFGWGVGGTIDAGDTDAWTYWANAEKVAGIRLTSEAFDPYLRLPGPNGPVIAESDDDAGFANSGILMELPATDEYTIKVRGY